MTMNPNRERPEVQNSENARLPEYAPRAKYLQEAECESILHKPGEPIFGEKPEAVCASATAKPEKAVDCDEVISNPGEPIFGQTPQAACFEEDPR